MKQMNGEGSCYCSENMLKNNLHKNGVLQCLKDFSDSQSLEGVIAFRTHRLPWKKGLVLALW